MCLSLRLLNPLSVQGDDCLQNLSCCTVQPGVLQAITVAGAVRQPLRQWLKVYRLSEACWADYGGFFHPAMRGARRLRSRLPVKMSSSCSGPCRPLQSGLHETLKPDVCFQSAAEQSNSRSTVEHAALALVWQAVGLARILVQRSLSSSNAQRHLLTVCSVLPERCLGVTRQNTHLKLVFSL